MSKPNLYHKTSAQDPQLGEALSAVLAKQLSLTLNDTKITKAEVWGVLSYAAVNRPSLDAAASELAGAPSGDRRGQVVIAGVPPHAVFYRQPNTVLRLPLPPRPPPGQNTHRLA